MAQRERELIAIRTKSALQAAKARGVVLGNPKNLDEDSAAKGRVLGVAARKGIADVFAGKVTPIIADYQEQGLSLNQIAKKLNESGVLTARGKAGSWTPTAVKNAFSRVKLTAQQ
jgi:DNA invertase Pin-like site-specific DNA recombinase